MGKPISVQTSLIALVAATVGLSGCATTAKAPSLTATSNRPSNVRDAMTQPVRDLGFARERPTDILLRAQANPYAPPPADCAALKAEIDALDAVLGRDVDVAVKPKNSNMVGDLAMDALQSAAKLPYRGIIRRLTGAERRDQAMRQATLAGTARRSYLKGAINGQGCNNPAPRIAGVAPAALTPPTADAVAAEPFPVVEAALPPRTP